MTKFHLRDTGRGALAYAEAVSVYLSMGLGKSIDLWSNLSSWSNAANMEIVIMFLPVR